MGEFRLLCFIVLYDLSALTAVIICYASCVFMLLGLLTFYRLMVCSVYSVDCDFEGVHYGFYFTSDF